MVQGFPETPIQSLSAARPEEIEQLISTMTVSRPDPATGQVANFASLLNLVLSLGFDLNLAPLSFGVDLNLVPLSFGFPLKQNCAPLWLHSEPSFRFLVQ